MKTKMSGDGRVCLAQDRSVTGGPLRPATDKRKKNGNGKSTGEDNASLAEQPPAQLPALSESLPNLTEQIAG